MWPNSLLNQPVEMARRCGYCGKFCNKDGIHEKTGLCFECKAALEEASKEENGASEVEMEDFRPRSATVDTATTAADAVAAHDTGGRETHRKETSELPNASAGDEPSGNGSEDAGNDQKDEDNSNKEGQLCGRCWSKPATSILYSCPTCDDCVDTAEKERANKTGKQRFQPKNPRLGPGKRLTKVCESCRVRRKRCHHRQIVNANDPGVAQRGKRAKMTEKVTSEPNGSESGGDDAMSSDMEVDPPVPDAPNDRGRSAEENLRLAIRDSVRVVYERELGRLLTQAEERVNEAQTDMNAAAVAMAAVESHMDGWQVRYDGYGLRRDEEETPASEAMEAADAAMETAKEKMAAWLEKFPKAD